MLLFDRAKKINTNSVRSLDYKLLEWLAILRDLDWKYQYKIMEVAFYFHLDVDRELREVFANLPDDDADNLGFLPLYSSPTEISIVCNRAFSILKKKKNQRLDLYCTTGIIALDYSSYFSNAIYDRISARCG